MADERSEWKILGRVIGTATGWDQGDIFSMCLYNFEPGKEVPLPKVDFLWFEFESGLAKIYDDDGKIMQSFDLIATLRNLPRCESPA